jgi:hypothetical protein
MHWISPQPVLITWGMGRNCFMLLCTVLYVVTEHITRQLAVDRQLFKSLHYEIPRKFHRRFSCWYWLTDGRTDGRTDVVLNVSSLSISNIKITWTKTNLSFCFLSIQLVHRIVILRPLAASHVIYNDLAISSNRLTTQLQSGTHLCYSRSYRNIEKSHKYGLNS